jgi:DNA mismatch endonuclease, patch repair protein
MRDRLSKERRSWNMSRIRGKDTAPEKVVRSLLHRMGYRFRLHGKKLPGRPDIVLAKYKTVVFVHGCFWHRHRGFKNRTLPKHRGKWWLSKWKAAPHAIG